MDQIIRNATFGLLAAFTAASTVGFAQDAPQAPPPYDQPRQEPARSGGWRRMSEPPADQSNPNGAPDQGHWQDAQDANQQAAPPNYQQNYAVPQQLTIRPGTFVTVRVNQPLSSDHNQPGDAFSATLADPIVVDGVVVAQRGQTIAGRVADARKAGRVEGVSRLGLQLTELTLVDGQQVPIQSQVTGRIGSTSVGRDVGAVAGTTALGAAVGAAADWGRGAGIGAAAGAVAGTVGVLLTRGHATVVYPESVLTFRIEAPVTFSTEHATQAFRYVDRGDYEQSYEVQPRPVPRGGPCGAYGCPPPPPYYYGGPAFYGPGFYPYYGSGFGFIYGPRFRYGYGGGFYYGRGFGRGYGRGFRR